MSLASLISNFTADRVGGERSVRRVWFVGLFDGGQTRNRIGDRMELKECLSNLRLLREDAQFIDVYRLQVSSFVWSMYEFCRYHTDQGIPQLISSSVT